MNLYETWVCDTCNCEVREDIYPCPNCNEKEEPSSVPVKPSQNKCPVCTYENPEFVTHCQMC